MKKILLLLLISFNIAAQTEIPLLGLRTTLSNTPLYVDSVTAEATFKVIDFSNQFSGLDLDSMENLVYWKNCERYIIDSVVTFYATSTTVRINIKDKPPLSTGIGAILQETPGNVSHLINGITASDQQCIDSYYRNAAIDSTCYCTITQNGDTIFVGDSYVQIDPDTLNELDSLYYNGLWYSNGDTLIIPGSLQDTFYAKNESEWKTSGDTLIDYGEGVNLQYFTAISNDSMYYFKDSQNKLIAGFMETECIGLEQAGNFLKIYNQCSGSGGSGSSDTFYVEWQSEWISTGDTISSDTTYWSPDGSNQMTAKRQVGINRVPFYDFDVTAPAGASPGYYYARIAEGDGIVWRKPTTSNKYGISVSGAVKFWNGTYNSNFIDESGSSGSNSQVWGRKASNKMGWIDDNTGTDDQTLTLDSTANYYTLSIENGNSVVLERATGGTSLWSQNGSDIYYNTGDVGIGTSTPDTKLDLYNIGTTPPSFRLSDGDINHPNTININPVSDANTIAQISQSSSTTGGMNLIGLSEGTNGFPLFFDGVFTQNTGTQGGVGVTYRASKSDGTGGRTQLGDLEDAFQWRNWTTSLMTIKGDGHMGLGTTNPSANLDVVGDAEINGELQVTDRTVGTPVKNAMFDANGFLVESDVNFGYLATSSQTLTSDGYFDFTGAIQSGNVVADAATDEITTTEDTPLKFHFSASYKTSGTCILTDYIRFQIRLNGSIGPTKLLAAGLGNNYYLNVDLISYDLVASPTDSYQIYVDLPASGTCNVTIYDAKFMATEL